MLSRLEISARLKAARWLHGVEDESGKPRALPVADIVQRVVRQGNRLTKNRVEDIEQMKVDTLKWEREALAESLQLPTAWFTEPEWWELIPGATAPEEAVSQIDEEGRVALEDLDDDTDEKGTG